jgi:transposase
MNQFIGCDAHKKFSLFIAMNEDGEYGRAMRVGHKRELMRGFLEELPPGSQIALETSGSYYWLVEEMERAGHRPQLAHALTAKRRMEGRHKTDELGREELNEHLAELPEWTRQSVKKQLEMVDHLETQIEACEQSLETMLAPNAERDLLRSLPGVGKILSAVIALEIGDIARFGTAQRLVSYAGLVPAARESAGKKRAGKCPGDCNTYLKWAFVEAANVIAVHHKSWPERHVAQLYARVKHRTKMHGKAAVAVGRHLAEASYWVLSKRELYREPELNRQALSSMHG